MTQTRWSSSPLSTAGTVSTAQRYLRRIELLIVIHLWVLPIISEWQCHAWNPISILYITILLQVVPGRAGGGSFRRKKTYIAKKEFAYRMCARRPTSAMPKPFLCCEPAFCCSMVVMWPVLMHVMSFDVVVMSFDAMWLLVLCHVTWCNAMSCDVPCNGHVVCSKWFCDNVVIQSTILYYKVLLCTTKYYSSTTLYYKVLLQYYPVQHSTTAVLQSTTPVLLCTTKQHSWLILVTYETSFTMRGATRFILQLHQILRLPRKMNLMIDPRLTWNVI